MQSSGRHAPVGSLRLGMPASSIRARGLVLLAGFLCCGLSWQGTAADLPARWRQLVQQNVEFCRTCRPNCYKTGTQEAQNCQNSSIRNPRFDYNQCFEGARSIQQLCLRQCNDMGC